MSLRIILYILLGIATAWSHSIEDKYLVVLNKDISHEHAAAHIEEVNGLFSYRDSKTTEADGQSYGGVTAHYDKLNIYSIHASAKFVKFLRDSYPGEIEFIEKRRHYKLASYTTNHESKRDILRVSLQSSVTTKQEDASEGLARISHRSLAASMWYEYVYNPYNITVPVVYVLDSGAQVTHDEFDGRASYGIDVMHDDFGPEDTNGHGTSVLGIAIGKEVGVARPALGVSIRVCDKDLNIHDEALIAAMNQIVYASGSHNLKVINMSIGGPESIFDWGHAVNTAANAAVQMGIHVVVAAGNDGGDVAKLRESPANAALVTTVGAINMFDERWYKSNFGAAVNWVAPGDSVRSSIIGIRGDEYAYISGTSIATPFVSGVMAYLLSIYGPMSPDQMDRSLRSFNPQKPKGFGPNARIIYNGSGY